MPANSQQPNSHPSQLPYPQGPGLSQYWRGQSVAPLMAWGETGMLGYAQPTVLGPGRPWHMGTPQTNYAVLPNHNASVGRPYTTPAYGNGVQPLNMFWGAPAAGRAPQPASFRDQQPLGRRYASRWDAPAPSLVRRATTPQHARHTSSNSAETSMLPTTTMAGRAVESSSDAAAQLELRQQEVPRPPLRTQSMASHSECEPTAKRQRISEQALAAHGTPAPQAAPPPLAIDSTPSGSTDLTQSITDFVAAVTPTTTEKQRAMHVYDVVEAAINKVVRQGHVQLFGSYASGLSIHCSDLDVVVTGVMEPNPILGYYDNSQKPAVVSLLYKILAQLKGCRELSVERAQVIRGARIPILKLTLEDGLQLDVSVADDSGPTNAAFVARRLVDFPAMRPLVLLLKCLLKQRGLNDVATGGLGSFSLANMVLCYLQSAVDPCVDAGDLGRLLLDLLYFYAARFNYRSLALSYYDGGVVTKLECGFEVRDRLSVKDPLSGRDISGGTTRIQEVRSALLSAWVALDAAVKATGSSAALPRPAGAAAPGALQRRQAPLEAMLDVTAAVKREGQGEASPAPAAGGLVAGRKRSRQ